MRIAQKAGVPKTQKAICVWWRNDMVDIARAYNTAAVAYRERYAAIGPRIDDVDLALSFLKTQTPKVVEIGCAYGREARYLLSKTSQYVGIDISQAYIDMAQHEVSGGTFHCVDVMEYDFPSDVDVVFAFASLLHLPKEDVATVLQRVASALRPGGVVFLSLKRRDHYETAMETDDLVSRRFYYYTRQTILDVAPPELVEVFYDEQELRESWFTMILQKQ